MGFGSGGGGFTPSPNNVPGSTETGTLLTDTHEFTGSVDITGSLTLNGASITGGGGGGGGAVSSYTNAGNDRVLTSVNSNTINGEASLTFDGTSLTSPQVTASVSMKTAALEISSSANGALFRIDHANQSGPEPILFVSSSGIIGIGTDNPSPTNPGEGDDTNRLHIVGNNGAEQNQAPVVNTQLVLENDNHAGLQFMVPNGRSGQITWGIPGNARKAVFYWSSANSRYEFNGDSFGGKRIMTMLSNGDSINIGSSSSGHMTTNKASLHISSSTGGTDVGGPVLLRVDHGDQPGDKPTLFVTGSGRVGIGTDSVLANLHVSSSDTGDLFRVDHPDHADNPILVVTGSGRIGIGTATPSAVLDVHPDNGAGFNEVKFRGSNGTSHFYFSSAEHTYIRGGKQTSTVFIADSRNTGGSDNQKCIIGNATSTTAQLHVSSSDNSTVMNVTSNSGSILTALENQRVGVGTDAPTAMLHVSGGVPTTTPLFRVDQHDQAGSKPILYITGSGLVGIGTDSPREDSDETNRLHILGESGADQGQNPVNNTLLMLENNNHVGVQFMTPTDKSGFLVWGDADDARRAHFYYHHNDNRFHFDNNTYGHQAMTVRASGDSVNMGTNNSAHMDTAKAVLHISSSTGGSDVGGPVLLRVDHADQPNSQPTLFVTGSGRVGIGTAAPQETLSISGSVALSGAFGNRSIETLTANGAISAATGLTIIDASSSLAVNNSLSMTIADGTFVGQEKKIRGMIISGSTGGATSTAINIAGANIDAPPTSPVGSISLSASIPGSGPLFSRAGCTLVWGGTKWLPVGNFNFNINNTGRLF